MNEEMEESFLVDTVSCRSLVWVRKVYENLTLFIRERERENIGGFIFASIFFV